MPKTWDIPLSTVTRERVRDSFGRLSDVNPDGNISPADRLTQYGITWFFSEPKQVGQYCNGDWWVLGPVTITKITPEHDGGATVKHGSTVNPAGKLHGYSTALPGYDAALNVAPSATGESVTLEDCSLMSAKNYADRVDIDEIAVLTVVPSVPAEGSFRPSPYTTTTKVSPWKESDLDYTVLRSLAPQGTPHEMTQYRKELWLRPKNLQGTNWQHARLLARVGTTSAGGFSRSDRPEAMPDYGREIAHMHGHILLNLHLNHTNAEKRDYMVGAVQYGIDGHGKVQRIGNGAWHSDGGWMHGQKHPLVFAAAALNSTEIAASATRTAAAPDRFQDDGQFFLVTADDVGKPVEADRHPTKPEVPYVEGDIGMPEWATRYYQKGFGDRSANATYRYVGADGTGCALAVLMLVGGRALWGFDTYFDYMDRIVDGNPVDKPDWPDITWLPGVQPWWRAMWDAYRGGY